LNFDRQEGLMDIQKIIEELREERAQLEEAILSIERLALGRGNRRGRPPSWMALAKSAETTTKRRGRPPGSRNKNAGAKTSGAEKSVD
jgi:hypothetical protein